MWALESQHVVDEFRGRAAEEKRLFRLAHPNYIYQPRKSNQIKRRDTAAKKAAAAKNRHGNIGEWTQIRGISEVVVAKRNPATKNADSALFVLMGFPMYHRLP